MTSRPLDILLLIIDAVGPETTSHATLSACALTCRAMRRRSQALLFNTVELSTARQCELFATTIYERPELGRLVKCITIDCPNTWVRSDEHPLPPYVVARLTSLKTAKFIGFFFGEGRAVMDLTFVLSFFKIFGSLTTMTELTLHSITFRDPGEMIRLVWSFPYVQHLSLEFCDLHKNSYENNVVLPTGRLHPGRCRALTSLTFHALIPLDLLLAPIWGGSITSLSIRHYGTRADGYAGLAQFTRLRSLTLSFGPTTLRFLQDMLSYVSAASIQELTVNLLVYGDEPERTSLIMSTLTLGKGPSKVLATWRRLEKIVWVLRYTESKNLDIREAVAREVEAKVPAPWLRSRFTCKVDTTWY